MSGNPQKEEQTPTSTPLYEISPDREVLPVVLQVAVVKILNVFLNHEILATAAEPQQTRVCLPPPGQHMPGVQQQQAAGAEAQVDPLLGTGHRPAPQEIYRQKAQPDVIQRGKR